MQDKYMSKNFDHFGIIAIIRDEIEILETLDSLIPHNLLVTRKGTPSFFR